MKQPSLEKIIDLIVSAAEDKKAQNIKIIDLARRGKELSNLVIMSGESLPQLKAISRQIESVLSQAGLKKVAFEGEPESGWIILDAGETVVHVMSPAERNYYNLEELWGREGIIYHY